MAWDIGAIEFSIGSGPPIEPDFGSGGGGGGFDSFGEPILPNIPSSRRWLVLGKFFYDSGTAYHAITPVQHPDYFYEARVLQWGFLDRSIPVPTGPSQVGDCRIRVADTDRQLRDRMSMETPRRRFIELRWVPEGGSESEFPPFATFEIKGMEFQAGDATIIGRDVHFAWVFKKFPNLINRTNFPNLITGFDEAQMPVIVGICISRADNQQGVIPLPRITVTRWGLAAHPVHRVVEIYRRYSGEGMFAAVDPSEYTITQDPPQIIEGIEYNLVFLDFYLDQDDGTEIRADVEGYDFRGNFYGMPAVAGGSGPLRNPVDFLINLLYVMLKSETEFPAFNIQSFINVRNQFEAIIDSSSGFLPYYCDGAITETLTCGEILSRFLTSFELDLYANRYGELELNLTLNSDPNRPVFDDTFRILRNSVRQTLAGPTYNRIRFRFERNYAEEEWGSNEVFNNLPDQLALGKIEEDTVDQWFVRDLFTAQDVIRRRAEFVALGSFRIEFDLPAPEVQNDIELAKLIGVTHYGGLAVGGYVNAEFKTTGITTDLDQFKTTLRGVLRVPQFIQNLRPGVSGGSQMGSGASAGSFGSSSGGSFGSEGPPPPPPTACGAIVEVTTESDDYNRVDNPDLGGNWNQFTDPFGNRAAFSISGNAVRAYNDNAATPDQTIGAISTQFASNLTHQLSRWVYAGSSQIVAPGGGLPLTLPINGGGPAVCMRPLSGSQVWDNNVECYKLEYVEERSRTSPYPIVQTTLYLNWFGAAGYSDLDFDVLTGPLSNGDVLELRAMYFTHPINGDSVCLHGYINGVEFVSKTLTHVSPYWIPNGKPGFGCTTGGFRAFAIDWDNWEGAECVPV